MKKLLLSFLCSFTLLSIGTAQNTISGNGKVSTESRNLDVFTEVIVSDGIDAYIHQASENRVKIEADENIIPEIRTEVTGGVLKIYSKKGFRKVKKMRVDVWMKDIERIVSSGGSDVFSVGTLSSPSLVLLSSGGSDLDLNLDVENMKCIVSGGSDADLEGRAENCNFTASGGSDIKAYGLKSSICKIRASGGSDAYVTVTKEIDMRASGASDVYYKGDAKIVNISVSGASDVHH